ncbi:MAG: protease modulator HflC [Syntrophales bacterium]|jgi:membrane protease subunit HflC|nr:protease modulator HflC [Syntrophales bacterium]MCK9527266.1 protease modulator HflC [Syntrophales bacterium]MDX9921264.1 protease modulator HflC [Syntrophales bacterium]
MNMKASLIAIVGILLAGFLSFGLFTVDQTQQAIVIQLGRPRPHSYGPGLHFKVPFVQEVVYFESRILQYDASPTEVLTRDKKNLVVDNFTKWRIEDPLIFYKSVRNETGARSRLDDIVYAQLRVELGLHDLSDIVSTTRSSVMEGVTRIAAERAKVYGIEVVDVRIKRADLAEQNEKHVFERMRAEREREARQYRSEGEEESKKITTQADMEKAVILAEAYRRAETLRGEGDAEAIRIYAEAYLQDPAFFSYFRSLEAYKKTMKDRTKLIVTPDVPFFRYLR